MIEPMPAITIWQPWASLIGCGAKRFETRSWATKHRGLIAIHAAAFDPMIATRDLPGYIHDAMGKAFKDHGYRRDMLDCGCIIATAELVGCHKFVRYGGRGMSSDGPGWYKTEYRIYLPTEQELLFGDWTPGRYAWELRNVQLLDTPIPAKGKQGLWRWEGVA